MAYYCLLALVALFSFDLTCPQEAGAELDGSLKRRTRARRTEVCESFSTDTGTCESKVAVVDSLDQEDLYLIPEDDLDIAHVFHAETVVEGHTIAWQSPADFVLAAGGNILAIEGNENVPEALEVVSKAPLFATLRGVATNSQWVQNYWGLVATSSTCESEYTICGFDLNQAQRPLDARMSARFAAIMALPYRHSNLKMQAASVVVLENGEAIVSRKLLQDNAALSLKEVCHELRKIGVTHPIWSPSLPSEPSGHMDMCVGFVNGHVVVPAIAPEAERFSSVPDVVSHARMVLDKIESIVAASGYPVERLMMPVPARVNALGVLPYYTPVNWLAVRGRDADGKAQVSLMIPVSFGVQVDRELVPMYTEFNEKTFRKIGVVGHYVGTILPEFGGGFKCISGRVPRKLLQLDA